MAASRRPVESVSATVVVRRAHRAGGNGAGDARGAAVVAHGVGSAVKADGPHYPTGSAGTATPENHVGQVREAGVAEAPFPENVTGATSLRDVTDAAEVPCDWLAAVPLLRDGAHLPLLRAVAKARREHTVYPPASLVFNALAHTPLNAVRVVIVGQDPYHGPGQAHGLAFSVPHGVPMPRSLRNIFAEVDADVHTTESRSVSSELTRWAAQGVLLLNSTLTVEAGKPASHAALRSPEGVCWGDVTDDIIRTVSEHCSPVVFLLWGAHARSKAALVDTRRHVVLEAAHPSPLSASRGFFGCRHFSRANTWLRIQGRGEVDW